MKKQFNKIRAVITKHPKAKWAIIIGLIIGFLVQISIPIIAAISLIN